MRRKPKILIVEDEHALAAALATVTGRMGAEPVVEPSGSRAVAAVRSAPVEAIVLDIGLPDMSGLDVLRECFGERVTVPVLVITAHGSLENAIAAKRMGVAEYLLKPLDLRQYEEALRSLLEKGGVGDGRGAEGDAPERAESTLIGAAPAMQAVFRDIAHACTMRQPLVISGPTGAGKTLAARVVHSNGDLASKPLLTVGGPGRETSVARAAEELERAGGGTMVVENAGEISPGQQAELLRLLEADAPGDAGGEAGGPPVRVIATAGRDLLDAVREGKFEERLYYRIRALEIRMPPLGERVEDIPALAAYFLGRICSDRSVSFSREALMALRSHTWPGNVLELRHAVEYGVSICGGGKILVQHLPVSVTLPGGAVAGGSELEVAVRRWVDAAFAVRGSLPSYADFLDQLETLLLSELLERFDGRPTRLAGALGMNRTTLRKRCARLGVGGKGEAVPPSGE